MNPHPRLKHMAPNKSGNCSICKTSQILRFMDSATGFVFGSCCIDAMKFADAALDVCGRKSGINHPQT